MSSDNLFKKQFIESKESVIAKANHFKLLQDYKHKSEILHVFVENDDDFEFFRKPLEHVYRNYKIIAYLAQGKKNVKDGFQLVNWKRFNKSRILFFADKDYDDILKKTQIEAENFFYTQFYSIENYLVNIEVFSLILSKFFLRIDKLLCEKLCSIFSESYKVFTRKMRALTNHILIYRELDEHLDLDKLKMSDFFQIDKMILREKPLISEYRYNIIKKGNYTPLEKEMARKDTILDILYLKCGAKKELVTFHKILKNQNTLINLINPQMYIRGKYDLWFLLEMINSADAAIKEIYIKDSIALNPEVGYPKKKIEINAGNIFHLIPHKMIMPNDAVTFLNLNFEKIHEND